MRDRGGGGGSGLWAAVDPALTMRLLGALVLLEVQVTSSFKFLAYCPQFAVSHVNFISKIADTLEEAGHEVVIVAPRVHPSIRGALTKRARVIELPENEYTRSWHESEARAMDGAWNSSFLAIAMEVSKVFTHVLNAANGLFHLVGINRTAFAVSFTNVESAYSITQMPSAPSYVPSIFSSSGDRMSFISRVTNTLTSLAFGLMYTSLHFYDPIFKGLTNESLQSIVASNSLVLLNSEPLLDYPRPTVHRVIDIGGIATATEAEPLDEYWSEILNRRNHTVILSFGTYVRASHMPDSYKETIRNAMATFDDVTFIWKYENPDHNVSQGIANIVETTWLPQVALLGDHRLTAFITHGGQGSTLEAAYAGKPMLMVPTQGDQHRNAAMIKRAGLDSFIAPGDIVQLSDLEDVQLLVRAIEDLLENEERASRAMKMAAMLKNRPFSAKEKLVRNMEFLARYGPLRMLDHEGRNLNFIQYYLIDVFMFLGIVIVVILAAISACCTAICRCCCSKIHRKYATLKQN